MKRHRIQFLLFLWSLDCGIVSEAARKKLLEVPAGELGAAVQEATKGANK